ncbi:MAG: PilZ domain-containing protein [Bacillota bacterium]
MTPLIIFKAISSTQDRKYLFDMITNSQGEIVIKDKQDCSIPLKAVSMNDQGQLQCDIPEGLKLNYGFQDVLTATFSIGEEKYLFETSMTPYKDGVILTVFHLFHLQRRKNFRYVLPQNYVGTFRVKSVNHKAINFECKLVDLSTEGCAVIWSMDMNSMQMGDVVDAEICLGNRTPIPVSGFVKNMRMKTDMEFVLGVEFDHLANSSEGKITSTLADLQREVYLRKAG